MPSSPIDTATIVLDTNVVLDWLVFLDAGCDALRQALEANAVTWIATEPMRKEFFDVVGRPLLRARCADPVALTTEWERRCEQVEPPILEGAAARIRCTDADDQMFVELAIGQKARWLVSRDRALLALARPLRQHGVTVVTPAGWAAP